MSSERCSVHDWIELHSQVARCAHLDRDFQAFADRESESEKVGQALLEQSQEMFNLWRRVKGDIMVRPDFQTQMEPSQAQVGELLREGTGLTHDKTSRIYESILKLEDALWTSVSVKGVEPINSDAERPVCRLVLWRRKSFDTKSEAGSLFIERVLIAVTTLRQQKRDVLEFLTEACAAAIQSKSSRSFLPVPPPANVVA